jgi:hypothetical protein
MSFVYSHSEHGCVQWGITIAKGYLCCQAAFSGCSFLGAILLDVLGYNRKGHKAIARDAKMKKITEKIATFADSLRPLR